MKSSRSWTMQRMTTFLLFLCLVTVQIDSTVSSAQGEGDGCPPNSKPVKRTEANGEVIVSCQCVSGYTKFQGRCEPIEEVKALRTAKAIRDAISEGRKPPFESVWDYHQANRKITDGFVGSDENRCAIVLSMTLGFEPRATEANLEDLKLSRQIGALLRLKRGVPPEISDAQLGRRYYIRAQELANRIRDEWGKPQIIKTNARTILAGKKGVVLLQDAYGDPDAEGRRTIDHIDVWNGITIGAGDSLSPNFEEARQVWFWPIP